MESVKRDDRGDDHADAQRPGEKKTGPALAQPRTRQGKAKRYACSARSHQEGIVIETHVAGELSDVHNNHIIVRIAVEFILDNWCPNPYRVTAQFLPFGPEKLPLRFFSLFNGGGFWFPVNFDGPRQAFEGGSPIGAKTMRWGKTR
ncbi:hypothetical protein [Pelagibacterium mangrovi]|uniref:hypothetical protein n=1 Tax=Pelagibacterium mangrovi TaxID=3119828 RepID=UPI002FC94E33